MIPSTGFLPSDDLAEPLLDVDLPVPYVGTYSDSNRRGKPSNVLAVELGSVDEFLENKATKFVVTIEQLGVYGIVMIDRIE